MFSCYNDDIHESVDISFINVISKKKCFYNSLSKRA